ncbi:uncharacterized protein LOC129224147 [Uloborus diversus]|uniref:uncharacterized protein LOC129224147 n=1 Tax=Uloborus diversus TaxID=327109 RepID=UPI0024092547|nr:uncharacterized protein LOC129224147 [Uloborus diversus]
MGSFGHSNVYIFISIFGGSTLLLFLICFCCQKKLQARTLAMADITNLESQRSRQRASRNQRRSDTNSLISAIITPPPDYATVIKKDSLCPAPPPYEIAMAELQTDAELRSDGFV